MEKRTYYMILGVPRTESPRGIRAAYRDLAKRLHPDVAGEETTPAFLEATEAYDVLSDAERRREYNARLREAEMRDSGQIGVRQPAPTGWPPAPVSREVTTIIGDPEGVRPSFEALMDRVLRNFTGVGVPQSERLESLTFEVLLTREEVLRGVTVPIGVPVFERCPDCGGSGTDGGYACTACGSQGWVEREAVARIAIAPMTPPGSVLEVPLHTFGIRNLYLRIYVGLQQ